MASSLIRIKSGIKAFVGTHVTLSIVSLAYGALGPPTNEELPLWGDDDNKKEKTKQPEPVFDAYHYNYVTRLVQNMYSGKGTTISTISALSRFGETMEEHPNNYIILDDKVTFEDPAAICSGREEVQEAFRALAAPIIHPESLKPPMCVDVHPNGKSIELTYSLYQRYGGFLIVPSLLVVHVHLEPIPNNPESKFVVTKMEEQWYGIKPLGSLLFWIVRRINGIISWNLTTRLIKQEK